MTTSAHKHPYKIVASDLDGTLLAPNHQLSEFSKQTLKQLHDKGFTFIFATGRHHIDVAGIREIAGIPAYMITSNGARVHDQNDQLMYSKNVPQDWCKPSSMSLNTISSCSCICTVMTNGCSIKKMRSCATSMKTLVLPIASLMSITPQPMASRNFFTQEDQDHEHWCSTKPY